MKGKDERKAAAKAVGKYLDKIDPHTPYQAKVKLDINHISNTLRSNDFESIITCTKIMSSDYGYLFIRKGFVETSESVIRSKGHIWNYNNLMKMKYCLSTTLILDCAVSSVEEVIPEYAFDKIIRGLGLD